LGRIGDKVYDKEKDFESSGNGWPSELGRASPPDGLFEFGGEIRGYPVSDATFQEYPTIYFTLLRKST